MNTQTRSPRMTPPTRTYLMPDTLAKLTARGFEIVGTHPDAPVAYILRDKSRQRGQDIFLRHRDHVVALALTGADAPDWSRVDAVEAGIAAYKAKLPRTPAMDGRFQMSITNKPIPEIQRLQREWLNGWDSGEWMN